MPGEGARGAAGEHPRPSVRDYRLSRRKGRTRGRPGRVTERQRTAPAVSAVTRVAAVLGFGGLAALVVGGILVGVLGAPPRVLDLVVGGTATLVVAGIGLGLLAGIGLPPFFDPETGRYRPPTSRAESAVRLLGVAAPVAVTIGMLALTVPWFANGLGAEFDDEHVPVLGAIAIGGVILSLALAGVAGGIVVLGAAGVFAGLLLAGGVLAGALGFTRGDAGLTVLGVVGMGIAAGFYFAGARAHGIPFELIGLGVPVAAAIVYGVVVIVLAVVAADALVALTGVLALTSAVGYLVGGLRRQRQGAGE